VSDWLLGGFITQLARKIGRCRPNVRPLTQRHSHDFALMKAANERQDFFVSFFFSLFSFFFFFFFFVFIRRELNSYGNVRSYMFGLSAKPD
jgi:ATP-dependent Zn protease